MCAKIYTTVQTFGVGHIFYVIFKFKVKEVSFTQQGLF